MFKFLVNISNIHKIQMYINSILFQKKSKKNNLSKPNLQKTASFEVEPKINMLSLGSYNYCSLVQNQVSFGSVNSFIQNFILFFKNNSKNNKELIYELSDTQFQKLLFEVKIKLKELGINPIINKKNILLIKKFYSDEKLCNNKNVKRKIEKIISNIRTVEQVKIVNKYLSDEELYNNPYVNRNLILIMNYTKTTEQAKIADLYFSNKSLYDNKNIALWIGSIISDIKTPEQFKIANKYLSSEKFYDNKYDTLGGGNIICSTKSKEQAQARLVIMDKYLSDERLYDNKNFKSLIINIIGNTNNIELANARINLIDKYLSDEKLYGNKIFEDNIGKIILKGRTPAILKGNVNLIDKYLSDEKLYKNKLINKNIGIMLNNNNSPEETLENLKILDFYINGGDILHKNLIQSAIEHKNLLKSAHSDITDDVIKEVFARLELRKVLHLIGLNNIEAAFPLTFDNFMDFVKGIANLKLSPYNEELILQKFNPLFSEKYKNLANEISLLKTNLSTMLSESSIKQIQGLNAQKKILESKINILKNDKLVDKDEVKKLQKQFKIISNKIQQIYFSNPECKELIEEIDIKTKVLRNLVIENRKLNPYEVVTKMNVLSVLEKFSTEEEMTKFINLIKLSTTENDKLWNEAINKKIFEKLDIDYNEQLSKKLDLVNCPYLSKMFMSCNDFWDNLRILVNIIKQNLNLSMEQAIDKMSQNIKTKQLFEELGIDYEKWTKIDKNSYKKLNISVDLEAVKRKAIENLEEDLNDDLFRLIPKEITEDIFKRLKKKLGVTFEKSQKSNWGGDGFNTGTRSYYRLYKDRNPITFEDMNSILSEIKNSINSNDFWTIKNKDSKIETARSTLYTHLIKMRINEVENALNFKEGENIQIEVRKTNMYDIKKALGLGNDAQCCTGLGKNSNEWTAPTYIMNKCIGAIELTDKGKFVGNTMIYLAYVDDKLSLILDNIELKTKYQNNDKIRDAFLDYAKKLCEEIGKPDIPIFAGPNRHKLNMDIYPKTKHEMQLIGNSGDQEVYLDYDAERHIFGKDKVTEIEMYKLR